MLSLIYFESLKAYPVFTVIFPRSALICYITVDIFVCCSWVDLIFPEPHLCLPARVYSSVWCCLKVPFTHQKCSRVVGEEGLVVVVEGCCAVSRSVRTHPSLSLLCPCSPPPAPPPPLLFFAPCCDAMQPFCTQSSQHHHYHHHRHHYEQQQHRHLCLFLYYYLLNLKNEKQHRPRNPRQEYFPLPVICFRFWVSVFYRLHNSAGLHRVCWGCNSANGHMWRHSRVFIVGCVTLAAHFI